MNKNLVLFKNKDFLKLWTGHFLSQISSYSLLFLAINKIFQESNSTIATGILWISFTLPNLFVSPFIGPLIDIWNKKKILVQSNLAHGLIILVTAYVTQSGKFFLIYPILFIHSLVSTINNPAEMAKTPEVIQNKKNLTIANNIMFFSDQACLLIATVWVGILLNLVSLPKALTITAFLAFGAGLITYSLPAEKIQEKIKKYKFSLKDFLERVQEGHNFLTENQLILYSFGLVIVFKILISTAILLLPVITKYIFKTSIHNGYLIILPLAIGLVGGTFILSKKQNKTRKKQWIGRGISLSGLILLILSLTSIHNMFLRVSIHFVLLLLLGFSASIVYAPIQTFIQEFTPGKMYGYTFSSLAFFTSLVSIPSNLLTTTFAEILGIRFFMTIISVALFLLGYFINKKGHELIQLATSNRN